MRSVLVPTLTRAHYSTTNTEGSGTLQALRFCAPSTFTSKRELTDPLEITGKVVVKVFVGMLLGVPPLHQVVPSAAPVGLLLGNKIGCSEAAGFTNCDSWCYRIPLWAALVDHHVALLYFSSDSIGSYRGTQTQSSSPNRCCSALHQEDSSSVPNYHGIQGAI